MANTTYEFFGIMLVNYFHLVQNVHFSDHKDMVSNEFIAPE